METGRELSGENRMLGQQKLDSLFLYGVLYLIFIYAPVILIVIFSFNDGIYVAFPFKGITVKWYYDMMHNAGLGKALRVSLKIGIFVSIVSTVFGVLGAKAVMRYHMPGIKTIVFLIMLPLVIPTIIFAIGLLMILTKFIGLQPTTWSVIAGHVLLCVPFSMAVMMSRLQGFDKNLEEASLDLGQNAWQTFWRVTFPLAMPGILASFLLCFTNSFDEYLIAAFLSGNDATLPVYIFSQLRFPNRLPGTLALGSCILVISFAIVTFAEWMRRKGVNPDSGMGI
jgi:spermidine/putrescine transport system permease protein